MGPLIERIEKLDKRVGELEKFAELIGEGLSKVYPDGFPSPLPSPSPSSSPLCTPSPPPSFEAEPREDLIDLDRVLEDLEATAAHFNELSARFESRFCELIKVFSELIPKFKRERNLRTKRMCVCVCVCVCVCARAREFAESLFSVLLM